MKAMYLRSLAEFPLHHKKKSKNDSWLTYTPQSAVKLSQVLCLEGKVKSSWILDFLNQGFLNKWSSPVLLL